MGGVASKARQIPWRGSAGAVLGRLEWVGLLAEVFERMSAANATITYDFDNVTFEASRVEAGGKALPSGKVRINGKITITSG